MIRVQGRCAACEMETLILVEEHVACSNKECPNPAAPDEMLCGLTPHNGKVILEWEPGSRPAGRRYQESVQEYT